MKQIDFDLWYFSKEDTHEYSIYTYEFMYIFFVWKLTEKTVSTIVVENILRG